MESARSVLRWWANFMSSFPLETRPPQWEPEAPPSVAVLFVFPRDRNHNSATSLDVQCLRAQTLLAISGFPHEVRECIENDQSPTGQLPYLLTTNGKVLAGQEIVDEVFNAVPEFAGQLSKDDLADSTAFSVLAETKLHFGLVYDFWFNPQNSQKVAFKQYATGLTWPLNLLVPRLKRLEQIDWMLTQRMTIDKDEILSDVKTALAAFSAQLDKKQYLFGSKPSVADAALFAYLHVFLSTFGPASGVHSAVRDIIKRHDNLIQVCYLLHRPFRPLLNPPILSIRGAYGARGLLWGNKDA
ncbi:metaxin 1 [Entophlyctis luteolus]|nr:metaxin 1 [Entophlyctis luteolus]